MEKFFKEIKSRISVMSRYFINAFSPLIKHGIDFIIIVSCYYLAFLLRFEGDIPIKFRLMFFNTLPSFVAAFLLCDIFFKLSRSVWRYVSIKDLGKIVAFILSGNGLGLLLGIVLAQSDMRVFPRSIYFLNSILLLVLFGGVRLIIRVMFEYSKMFERKNIVNVLIVGEGDMAASLQSDIAKNYPNMYRIIGFIANSKNRVSTTINTVPVIGLLKDLKRLVETYGIKYIFIALDKASAKDMKEAIRSCEDSGAICKIIPTITDVITGSFSLKEAREVKFEDYLRREPVSLDLDAVRKDFKDKIILISGAGGSIGAQIARELCKFNYNRLILLDHSEANVFNLYCEFKRFCGKEIGRKVKFIIGDICDAGFMRKVFEAEHIDYIIHAAANKHVFLSETNIINTVKTNVCGTDLLAKLAAEFKANKFVLISTDKAVEPISIMGATKRLNEFMMQAFNQNGKTRYITVRFGNVIGSSGNCIEIFQRQILAGEALTITHPDAERYFMSIDEAARLVLQAAVIGEGGEIFILDMGEPVKIKDLAKDMFIFYGKKFKEESVIYTGLRPGEKITEKLVSANELKEPTRINKIFKIRSKSYMAEEVVKTIRGICQATDEHDIGRILELLHNTIAYHGEKIQLTANK